MIRIIIEGFMLGLSVGFYCVGVCLVFFMPYLLTEGKQKLRENIREILLFMLGRLIAYTGFGLAAGILGETYRDVVSVKVSYWGLTLISLLMLFYALTHNFADTKFCKPFVHRFSLLRIPFFLGIFSGLNPCPPFLVGVVRVFLLHNVVSGVILFVAFFLGTSVYMIPLVFASFLNQSKRIRQIGATIALLSSLWFLFVGISGLMK